MTFSVTACMFPSNHSFQFFLFFQNYFAVFLMFSNTHVPQGKNKGGGLEVTNAGNIIVVLSSLKFLCYFFTLQLLLSCLCFDFVGFCCRKFRIFFFTVSDQESQTGMWGCNSSKHQGWWFQKSFDEIQKFVCRAALAL